MKIKNVLDVETHSPEYIAKKHGVSLKKIKSELKLGIQVELEHTTDENIAREIALDHLLEMPDYYTKLHKMEKE